MRKIKNFKINFRQREVIRLLKSAARISEITPQLEEAVAKEGLRLQKIVAPAALYETLTKDKLPASLIEGLPGNCVAASLFLVTISAEVEEEIREADHRGEEILGRILHCLSVETLEQSSRFVERLINEEAKGESCEISGRLKVEPALLGELVTLLSGDKISISLQENGTLKPLYTTAGVIHWTPVKKQGGKPAAKSS